MAQLSQPIEPAPTLLSAPIELAGDWGAHADLLGRSYGRADVQECYPQYRLPPFMIECLLPTWAMEMLSR
jgi:hypothetical protein